jgi:heme exporter protein A
MLSLHSLGFSINDEELFREISISFLPSSIIYLKGKNGAGKSSLLRMIANIQKPSSGKITFSKDSLPITMLKKPYCTYIGHRYAIKPELTVFENIHFWSKLYNSEILIDAAIVYFELQDILSTRCLELSAGTQKKVALARLIACQSKLWLLDEIDSSLDSEAKKKLMHLIISHANNGGIVLFASHNEPEIKTAQIIDLNDYSTIYN